MNVLRRVGNSNKVVGNFKQNLRHIVLKTNIEIFRLKVFSELRVFQMNPYN